MYLTRAAPCRTLASASRATAAAAPRTATATVGHTLQRVHPCDLFDDQTPLEPFPVHTLPSGVRVLTLNHNKANSMCHVFLARQLATLDALAAASSRAPLIVRSASERIFCAGLDVPKVHRLPEHGVRAFVRYLNASLWKLLAAPYPTVAAIDGAAIAGGGLIALACDMRVASPTEKQVFGLNESAFGVGFPGGPNAIIRTRVPRASLPIIAGGLLVTPREAAARGLVDIVADDDDGDDICALAEQTALHYFPADTNAAFESIKEASWLREEREIYERNVDDEDDRWVKQWMSAENVALRERYFASRGLKL